MSFLLLGQQQPPFYGHYTGQPALASNSSYELEDFVGAKFYCPHALADSNQRIQIRKKCYLHCLCTFVPLCQSTEWNTKHWKRISGIQPVVWPYPFINHHRTSDPDRKTVAPSMPALPGKYHKEQNKAPDLVHNTFTYTVGTDTVLTRHARCCGEWSCQKQPPTTYAVYYHRPMPTFYIQDSGCPQIQPNQFPWDI